MSLLSTVGSFTHITKFQVDGLEISVVLLEF